MKAALAGTVFITSVTCSSFFSFIVIGDGLRQRKQTDESDIDAVLKHHRKVHEKLTEELLHHTMNLKDFAYSASSIVKKDIKVKRLRF